MTSRAHTQLGLRIALCAVWVAAAGASSAAPTTSAPPAPDAAAPLTPVIEIGPQAERVATRLRDMSEAVSDVDAFARLEADVARVSQSAAESWDETARTLDGTPRRAALEGAWNALRVEFARLGDDLAGRVQRRESDLALRSFDGAEVIVPNTQLVGDRITNWTLSDKRRRISLTLAVDANEDPSRVLGLLLEVARSDPRVASQPFPEALLVRLAGSQLEVELRAWTEDPNWMRVRSDLAVAVHAALKPAR